MSTVFLVFAVTTAPSFARGFVVNEPPPCMTLPTSDGGTPVPTPCVFPFRFGLEDEVHTACTTLFDPEGRPWCSVAVDERGFHLLGRGNFGHCDLDSGGCAVESEEECSAVPTDGGVATREPCVFPFIFEDVQYDSCTTVQDPDCRPWCSVEVDPDTGRHRTGRFGHCDPETCDEETPSSVALFAGGGGSHLQDAPACRRQDDDGCATVGGPMPGRLCIFPFETSSGLVHRACTLDLADDGLHWCSVSVDAVTGRHRPGHWGHCGPGCPREDGGGDFGDLLSSDPNSGAYLPDVRSCFLRNPQSAQFVVGESSEQDVRILGLSLLLPTGPTRPSVVGGDDAALFEFPFAVLVGYATKVGGRRGDGGDDVKYLCGGSLINKKYVLTAAHCFPRRSAYRAVEVLLGEHDLSADADCEGDRCAPTPQRVPVSEVVSHPEYDVPPGSFLNDVALVRLASPPGAHLNDNVAMACLPVNADEVSAALDTVATLSDLDGAVGTVVGWGRTQFDSDGNIGRVGAASAILQKVRLPFVTHDNCSAEFARTTTLDPDSQLCAGGELGRDSCKGDSGGPLLVTDNRDNMVQVGVVSFGSTACGDGLPGVYTRVTHFMPWIARNLRP